MKSAAIIVFFLALSAFAEEEAKKTKRGVFGEGISLGHDSLDFGLSGHGWESQGLSLDHGYGHGPIDLGSSFHKHTTITQKIGVPIPQPYPVHVEKKIPVPYPVKVPVHVPKPYPVAVPKPYPVVVEKPYPVTVEKHVPYPVKVPVHVPYKVPVAVPVPKPYPVTVTKHVPIHVPTPVFVKKHVPVYIKEHHNEWQSGWHGGLSLNAGLGGWKGW